MYPQFYYLPSPKLLSPKEYKKLQKAQKKADIANEKVNRLANSLGYSPLSRTPQDNGSITTYNLPYPVYYITTPPNTTIIILPPPIQSYYPAYNYSIPYINPSSPNNAFIEEEEEHQGTPQYPVMPYTSIPTPYSQDLTPRDRDLPYHSPYTDLNSSNISQNPLLMPPPSRTGNGTPHPNPSKLSPLAGEGLPTFHEFYSSR